jgi:transcription antitermination factor NusG
LQEGAEKATVVAIFNRCITSGSVLAAFTRDNIKGSVYVESTSLPAICNVLNGMGHVLHNSGGPLIDLVPLEERVPLLNLPPLAPIKQNSWVRVKHTGTYRDRLAFVKAINLRLWTALVVLIPTARSRTTHMKKRLMRLEEGDFHTRLAERKFSLDDLTDRSVNATQGELDAFSRSHDEQVAKALEAGTVTLKPGDKVCVFTGSLQGLEGTIMELLDNHTLTLLNSNPSTAVPASLQVPTSDVCKKFVRGDYVRVMHGEHCGQEGFILEMDDTIATMYNPQGADYEV